MSYFFFDLDGTLIDSESIWTEAIVDALRQRNVIVSRDYIRQLETGHSWPDIFDEIHRQWPHSYATRPEMEAVTTAYYQAVVAVRDIAIHPSIELLKKLAADGHTIAIVTGSVKDRARQVCARYGMQSAVSDIVSCEDYQHGKPHPECYVTAARRAGIAPEDGIVFEDAPSGVSAAKAAGMTCVALARTPEDAEVLRTIADVVLPSLELFSIDILKAIHSRTR